MTYACPAWEFAADNYLLKLQSLQNSVLRTIGHFPRRTPVREIHVAFEIPYVYEISSLNCAGNRQKSYKITLTQMFATLDKAKPSTENIRGLNLAAVRPTTVQVTSCRHSTG
jgi:hypothetical protein